MNSLKGYFFPANSEKEQTPHKDLSINSLLKILLLWVLLLFKEKQAGQLRNDFTERNPKVYTEYNFLEYIKADTFASKELPGTYKQYAFRFGFVSKHRIWLKPAGWYSEWHHPIEYDKEYFISLLEDKGIGKEYWNRPDNVPPWQPDRNLNRLARGILCGSEKHATRGQALCADAGVYVGRGVTAMPYLVWAIGLAFAF